MPSLFRRATRILLVASLPLIPASVCAQSPAPPDQGPPPPAPQDPPPPADDGPKPAGVGSSQPPKPEDKPTETEAAELLPATSFPGVPLSGTLPSMRPYQGLFGGSEPLSRLTKHSLSLSGSLFGAYSTNVAPQLTGDEIVPLEGERSVLAGGSGSLNYLSNWSNATFGAHADGSRSWVEAYEEAGQPWINRWNVGVLGGFSKQLGRKARFNVSGSADYSPYLQFGVFNFVSDGIFRLPNEPAGLDRVLARDPSVWTRGAVTSSYALSRKSSLEGYYNIFLQNFVAADAQYSDRRDQAIGGRYRYQFGRFVGVRAGYGYRSFAGPDNQPVANHYIDVGVDAAYGRSFALTRRTTFSFTTNSGVYADNSGVDADGSSDAGEQDSFDPRTRLIVGGSADLTHTMGRSWIAQTGYRRGVSYEAGFDRPLLSDTGLASLTGQITPRLDFRAYGYITSGSVGFSGSDNGYGTSSATATLQYAITRQLAAYTQYFYYHYLFQQGVTLPGYLQSNLDRQGVSVGLTAWLPLIGSRGLPLIGSRGRR